MVNIGSSPGRKEGNNGPKPLGIMSRSHLTVSIVFGQLSRVHGTMQLDTKLHPIFDSWFANLSSSGLEPWTSRTVAKHCTNELRPHKLLL